MSTVPSNPNNILLVTATQVESRAVISIFHDIAGKGSDSVDINGRIYFDLGVVHNAPVYLTQSEVGSEGLGASIQTVQEGLRAIRPRAVIMVGIAFGIDQEKQEIGEILVATQLRPYEIQRVGARIILRGDKPHCSPVLINRMRSAELSWLGAPVRFGLLLSGEKLVDNQDFRAQLQGFEPEAVGGEMEGAGLYLACHNTVESILVKAICDWADGSKSQDKAARQRKAASNAAEFVLHALQFTPFESAGANDLESTSQFIPPFQRSQFSSVGKRS